MLGRSAKGSDALSRVHPRGDRNKSGTGAGNAQRRQAKGALDCDGDGRD